MLNVILDNISLYKEFGIVLGDLPIIPVIKERINSILIEGKNGTLTEKLGYEDRQIVCNFAIENNKIVNIQSKIRNLTTILLFSKTLRFSDDLDIYWKIKNVIIGDITRRLKAFGTFNITFIVEPFSYLEEELININKSTIIYNNGSYYSEPYIKIYGTGNVILTVNNKSIILKNIDNYIELDTELMQCKKEFTNKNNLMTGDFPIFKIGENNITWTGEINKIEIKPRWRFL